MNIEELELPSRALTGLKSAGIFTVEQLINLRWDQLTSLPKIGEKSVFEVCWQCMQLMNGRLMKNRMDFEKQFPAKPINWMELINKSKKYDAIVKIISK